jgi:CheY-like chemotaxis protein
MAGGRVAEARRVILHVEDDRSLQALVRATLEHLGGFAVRTAGDGCEALARAQDEPPDLILLDLDLPGMDGVETLRALREVERLREVPVLFLTATGDPVVLERLAGLCVRGILGKPFRPRQLLRAIDAVLGSAGKPA